MAIDLPAREGVPLDTPTLYFMIHHVFLPPRLPQEDDTNGRHLLAMTQVLRDSISDFMAAECSSSHSLQPALEMLGRFLSTNPGPDLGKTTTAHRDELRSVISNLKDGDVALLHLRDQNAGLLLTSRQDNILFETFELLAPNRNVMSCKGSLLRKFPDRAATVPLSKLRDPALLDQLVDAIQELESNVAPMARPKVTKAKTVQPEPRDTLSPIIATGLLTDVLVGLGREVVPNRITKRSREQVCYSNAFLPFHRSPTWLLLRVALRLVLDRIALSSGEKSWYKPLMAYHHARILDLAGRATQPSIPSDQLFSMKAKLVRRIVKLDPAGDTCSGWLKEVREIVVRSQGTLASRWDSVRDEDNQILPLDEISEVSFRKDSELKLEGLRNHLSWIESRHTGRQNDTEQGDITRFHTLSPTELPSLRGLMPDPEDAVAGRCELVDFEAWVESSLPGWSKSSHLSSETAVNDLGDLISTYYRRASTAYDGIPGALSVMYMVIAELWIAMDTIAGEEIPLLLDYDPGFPSDMFHLLLLERKEEMGRLNSVENYLSSRRARAPNAYQSAFTGFGHHESFAVRFYDTSAHHQRIRQNIRAWASIMQAEKLEEYQKKMHKHSLLAVAFHSKSCEFYWHHWSQKKIHSSSCERCRLEHEMDSLKIKVFEFPLPESPSHAEAAVFEISVPRIVALWRDVTWRLVTEVFYEEIEHHHKDSGQSLYFAAGCSGMSHFLEATSRHQPASTVKPMEVAHYSGKHILEASPENICVPHAARYTYYDEPSRIQTETRIYDACIPRHCSYAELVRGDPVEDWIRYTKHTSNDIIAGQYRCPLDVTLGEFRDFGNLRSGVGLQWANILCQLVIPSVDFNKKQTLALILQACLEVGPQPNSEYGQCGDSIWREAHIDTQTKSFMNRILSAMSDALQRVRESWQNDNAVCVLTCLATRLLSLSPSPDISSALLEYLGQLREVSIVWARLLLDKLNKSDKISDRQRWISKLLMAALTCGATFNMEGEHLESILNNPNNLSRLVESAVLARNHLPPSGKPTDAIALQLMQRWHIVMFRTQHFVMKQVMNEGNRGLDSAIGQFWADYSPSSSSPGWTQLDLDSQSHILTRKSGPVLITFNLLTGNLFLNGCPLSKLPSSYQKHPTFSQLFGQQILDVGPSSVPGMEFSASRDQNGWVLHFAMKDGRLVVRAIRQRSQDGGDVTAGNELQPESWEYIPREHLVKDLPNSFVNDYAHWLKLSTGQVEFRPANRKWDSTPENWCLTREHGRHILRKGSLAVIDPSSPTAVLSHRILGRIESFWNINVIFNSDDSSLALELPRLSLSFQILQGETTVRSKNYTGMQISNSQGIHSLVGLVDKLVLEPERGPGFRIVLVPRGQVSACLTEASGHVKVSIHRDNDKRVRHDSFLVDDKLGCLIDTGALQSRLYLCWLHALTSHCLPDPLTSRTGTEEARRILQGAAVKSYPTLDHDSRELLAQIAKLSPPRTYYPSHLQDMEQTIWNETIPPLSQDDDFWPLAKSVYDDYETSRKLFRLGTREADTTSAAEVFSASGEQRSSKLAERARIRNAIFRVSEFGAEGHTTAEDTWYHPSDRAAADAGSRESRAMVPRLVKCMDMRTECIIFEPSFDLPRKIEAVNGTKFSGTPEVTIGFDLGNLRAPSTALRGLWCGLHRELVAEENKYKKIFFLSSLLYAKDSDPEVVQALMSLSNISVFAQANMLPPPDPKFDLDISRDTLCDRLMEVTDAGRKKLEECCEYRWTRPRSESVRSFENRREQEWRKSLRDMTSKFVIDLKTQVELSWTVNVPTSASYRSYLHVDQIMPGVLDLVQMARRSEAFRTYLALLSRTMGEIDITESCEPVSVPIGGSAKPLSRPGFVSAMSLFSQPAPYFARPRPDVFPALRTEAQGSEQNHVRLSALVDDLSGVESLQAYQASYIGELRRSMASPVAPRHDTGLPTGLFDNLKRAQEEYDSVLRLLRLALRGTSIAYQLCGDAGVCPRISPIFLLQRLTRSFWSQLSTQWRHCFVNFALSFVYLQRAERLYGYGSDLPRRMEDLQRELSNPGDHGNPEWDPLEYPESLLLEVEQGIMIRSVQNKIGSVMRSPPGMENSVMQLNMGEGKSSVIVPIVAAALANGEQLVRVVVGKPQSNQMTHLLISKLGGLMNRRVFYLPFSRSIQLSDCDVTVAREMIEKCKIEGGVLLVQPEHLLSLKLMGIDKSWAPEEEEEKQMRTDDRSLGEKITSLYQDFESISRDIVDESDENFSVKFELIYTMGAQEAVEMSPNRWILIQQLLAMTEIVTEQLMAAKDTLSGVAEGLIFQDNGAGRVPIMRVLDESVGRHLVAELAAEVCRRGLVGFPVHHQSTRMRQAVRNYILVDQAAGEDVALVEGTRAGLFSSPAAKDTLLLLRGLLAKGIIMFVLGQKRFRVNYGLAPGRRPQTMLAVPYRAKDMPSPRSEFSHPDIVIVLTCLSYYYSGLSNEQLYTCFELLNASDQAEHEYGRWVATSPCLSESSSFRHFSSINIEDKPQCENIVFPALRYSRPVADFYLNKVVFPKEMKQFPLKLASSGWDLAKPKKHPLTGFSGTNDSKGVLPLSVAALDLQPHTNAAVLSTILGDENTVLEIGGGRRSSLSALTEEMLLGALAQSEPPMRVILDVGAQIIESANLRMAEKLLGSVPVGSAEAVIFFNDEDELSVLLRNGDISPFLTSPFATHTDRCLVFLDQAHTRGTDLKLPSDYRAAVTLGPGVTKDTLVQACMRMRKLGQGQSVTFIVSPEMQKRIRAIRNMGGEQPLTVADVIAWAISETWDEAVRSVPLWASQGVRHIRQEAIWRKAESQGVFSASNAREYLETEGMCLEERYRPRPASSAGGTTCTEIATLMASLDLEDQPNPNEAVQKDGTQISAIREKLLAFTHATRTSTVSSTLQEEQERELAPEIEEERHVARPPPRTALPHKLHRDLIQFARTGRAEASSLAFSRPFLAMSTTTAASLFRPGLAAFPSDLLVTEDFARTVKETGPSYHSDSYQRGVQWVLVSSARLTDEEKTPRGLARMVLVSQWEASRLKKVIEKVQQEAESTAIASGSKAVPPVPVTLHAYLPRPSLTFRTMEHLKTYTVPARAVAAAWESPPPELVMQLNLFAGQLYLRSYDEYKRLCRYLGLAYTANEDEDAAVPPDGFVGRKKYGPECEFESSPVPFLSRVYNIRRDWMGGIEKTHMGRILAGEILTEKDF
ncbi:hypothetical protein QBC44DRAFT_127707 [Cladorrhinum sp. PSN332]|nr:hypothetical protein QBC44DRAFT_127707 [Cladorrhinum sp. PSN332]